MEGRLSDRLAADLHATPRRFVSRRLLLGAGAGFAGSLVLVATLGWRPDMPHAMLTAMFWAKLAYVAVLAGVALWTMERLARPGEAGLRGVWLVAPVAVVAALAAMTWSQAPAPLRAHMVMGDSAAVCPWLILLAALPPLGGLVWALRGLAPTRPLIAGGVSGLAAGGVGASAYCLHCPESTLPFLAIWYTAGVLAAGVAGVGLGPRVLRW